MTICCIEPFRKIEIHVNGDVTVCCYSWLPKFCGNLVTDSFEQILSNATRTEILHDMKLGKFTYCNAVSCPYLSSYNNTSILPDVFVEPSKIDLMLETDMEYRVYLSYDRSCNLQCKSCRNELIMHRLSDIGSKISKIHTEAKKLVDHLLASGKRVLLNITGSGDPFASQLYSQYLNDLARTVTPETRLRIKLMTNGVLMSETMWNSIRPLLTHIHSINIGVDAASKNVYDMVRKNGNFVRLRNNLLLLDNMIGEGDFSKSFKWILTFVVQQHNYKEVKEFVSFRDSFKNAPNIYFSMIDKWGHLDDDSFSQVSLTKQQRKELKSIIADPIFKSPGLDLGNLNSLV